MDSRTPVAAEYGTTRSRRVFVVSARTRRVRWAGSRSSVRREHKGDDPETVLLGGGSCIVSPLGEVLAGPLRHDEGILTAELDLGEIVRSRFDFDVTGHYARPDVFSLSVDETPRPTVDGHQRLPQRQSFCL
ncbi:nitrilase-related carbon-nitrogen hydrolase [Streptomyces sp. NPDC050743]|uniref:nitrilase-related carbon-nitrogen hydrolase n=1 Tax=Streptomyces sp. NPDC050743 TaxID=3365634 RepID=UPI00379CD05C